MEGIKNFFVVLVTIIFVTIVALPPLGAFLLGVSVVIILPLSMLLVPVLLIVTWIRSSHGNRSQY